MKDEIARLRKAEHLISAALSVDLSDLTRARLLEARSDVIHVRVSLAVHATSVHVAPNEKTAAK